MTDTKELIREVASEVEKRTSERIERYQEMTTNAIVEISLNIKNLSENIQESNKQLIRYEEKQLASHERMERIEQTQKEQGRSHSSYQKEMEAKISALTKDMETKHQTLRDEVKDNSFIRKAIVWITTALVLAMIGGGALFGSLTGKTPPSP
jgi:Fe2+ transport system protein B